MTSLVFDNVLKPGWDVPLAGQIPQFAHFLQWADEPQANELGEPAAAAAAPSEQPVFRAYSESELQEFYRDQMRMYASRKIYLVLDIDHTLLHCTRNQDNVTEAPSFTIGDEQWFFHFRPGLMRFLLEMHQHFEILLYTFSTRPYAEQLANAIVALVPDGHQLRFRTLLTRNECLDKCRKSLQELFPVQSMVLAIDDNKGAVWAEKDNLIKVPPYYYFGKKARGSADDCHLSSLAVFLKKLHQIFFEQQTCEIRVLLFKLREMAALQCPLDMLAIEQEWERKRKRRREKARRKQERARREAERVMAAEYCSEASAAKAFVAADTAAALACLERTAVLAVAGCSAAAAAAAGAAALGLATPATAGGIYSAASPPPAGLAWPVYCPLPGVSDVSCSCAAAIISNESGYASRRSVASAADAKRAGRWLQQMHSMLHPELRDPAACKSAVSARDLPAVGHADPSVAAMAAGQVSAARLHRSPEAHSTARLLQHLAITEPHGSLLEDPPPEEMAISVSS
eukprot:RCo041981